MTDRTLLSLTGTDRVDFLQGLVTNDITQKGLTYNALLTPQGKYIADFFVLHQQDELLIDVASIIAAPLAQRLNMYRLRADVQITQSDLNVSRGIGLLPNDAFADPRHPDLGWRLYGLNHMADDVDWDTIRVAHLIPETGIELTPDSYIIEVGFERLNGVDFKKGCYVGQEIVARMKHKTTLKKGLARVSIKGSAMSGDAIMLGDKAAGTLHTIAGDHAIAYLRFDRATDPMQAGSAMITML